MGQMVLGMIKEGEGKRDWGSSDGLQKGEGKKGDRCGSSVRNGARTWWLSALPPFFLPFFDKFTHCDLALLLFLEWLTTDRDHCYRVIDK